MLKNHLLITLLSVTATALLFINCWPQARADMTIKDRDYQAVTARISSGGEGLYLLDNRTGNIALFTYDPNSRTMRARQVRPVADLFPR